MVSVNSKLIKNCFTLYEDQSLYNNYLKIASKYYKLYKENNKDKKYSSDNQDKLREDVKKWIFNQSLENRMKICTVENEFFGKILYQMISHKTIDKSILFRPKKNFFSSVEENNEQFTKNIINQNDYNYNEKIDDGMAYPTNNTNIKITRTNKAGKKTEAQILGYSQANLDCFKNEEIFQNNFGNCFTFQSYRKNFSFREPNENQNEYNERQKMIELCSENFLNNIIFFSVHHRYFPDCFTLSPEFLLEKEKFENIFNTLGNTKYFCNLIQSDKIQGNSKGQKQYCYNMPDWFQNNYENEDDLWYPVSKYALAFFEQVIMIKYLLNKNDKKLKTYSLLDEEALNRFFTDRKSAINYMKKNYNNENKINILKELEIEKCYNSIVTNNEKMKYVNYFKQSLKKINKEDKFKNNPYVIEDNILNNPFSNKIEEKFNKMKGIKKPNNSNKHSSSNRELTLEEITIKMSDILKANDFIYFIDYLLFQNFNNLWKVEFFLQSELFEKLSNLITEQNCKELIFDSKQGKSNKKHRKKNKKHHNNNNTSQPIQKEEEKNNKIENEYEGIFKDEEEELYAPYYLRANTEQRKLYLKLKGNYLFGNKEKEEIRNFISNEIILGIIIDNVFLTPLNSGLDFYEEIKKYDSLKDDKAIDINEINLVMDNETKNENDKNENKLNFNNINTIKEEEKDSINIIDDNNSNYNINNNTDNNNNIDNNKELMISTSVSRENEIDNNDSISLKSDNLSSEIDKATITSTTNTNAITNINEIIINNNESKIKDEENNINNNKNNIKINENETTINKKEDSKSKKKKEKEQKFFLYNTVKKKKKKTNISQNNNSLVSNEFNIISIKEPNRRLSFFDKLHNDIIKYETKVVMILNHGMKFKDYCIKEIKRLIEETSTFSKDYSIDVYGSYATGLMIEASDIDIKIKLNKGNKTDLDSFFETLGKKLENEKKFDKITPISTASVPVIKLLLSSEKFIKGKDDLENSFKQYKEMSLFKNYIFDTSELTKIKIDVTFILVNDNKSSINNNDINEISEKSLDKNSANNSNNNEATAHDHDKSIGGEMSSVLFVKEQIIKYPEVKYILRVLKRYFYYKKMNTSFLGGLSSYNLFLLLLSYAKFLKLNINSEPEIMDKNNNTLNNKSNTNLGYFLFNFLDFFKVLNFKQCIIDINSPNIYEIYDIMVPEKSKEFNFGKSIVIIDPLTGVNASKSSYKIEEIQNTFSEAFDFFYNEKIKYDKEGKTKISKNNNSNKDILIGLPISNKNDNNHGGGSNIIEKFLGK